MDPQAFQRRRHLERLDAYQLAQHQLAGLNRLLETILPHNRFYARKLAGIILPCDSLESFRQLPFTYKAELISEGQAGSPAANLTWPPDRYVRFHRTSGTCGGPIAVLDTHADWQWWVDTWQFVLDAAEVTSRDRALMAFSFGPFIGFWSACDALTARGAMVIPGGGLNTRGRLELLCSSGATLLCCTPSYALHMAEEAAQIQLDIARSDIRCLIVAGEPGGSVPAVRERLETAWGASVVDHSGATEVGPWGYADAARKGLHIVESEFIAEFLSHRPAARPAMGNCQNWC